MEVDDDGSQAVLRQGVFSQDNRLPSTNVSPLTLVDLLQSSSPSIDFTNSSATHYVDSLLSLSLHELLRQPQVISAEASTVESDLTNLCFREYSTFISVHKCSSAVSSAFDDFSGSLGKLIGAIPSLEDECKSFSTATGTIQNVRGKAALVQEHQDKLLDLLELPQLMETCVRNGYYQEAMELLNHCRSLKQKHPLIALVQDVNKEVEGILQLMLAQLLALLREPVKLPALVKTVSFLRRLDAMEEDELGLVFISSRYHNFRSQLLSIDRDRVEPVRYLRKYIDLFREHVYDIIAQFSAIFLETSPSEIAAIHITSFANQAISDLVDLVTAYVPRIASDSGSMSSILVQLGYCAMSFSRVGLDFAPLISAPFSSTVLSTFSQALATASNDFSSILRDSAKAVLPPSQILVSPEHIPSIVSAPTSPPSLPSIDLSSHFPPIATLINAYITAFNNLRLLAPLELHSQLISIHSSSLLASTNVLLQYVTQATTISNDPPMSPVKTRPGHGRTASAPRADLLRRNSDAQMTPEARAAKRREAKRVCVASADVWCRIVVPFLVDKLNDGVFADVVKPAFDKDLKDQLEKLEQWVNENGERLDKDPIVNGDTSPSNDIPRTPPRKHQPLVSSPITVGSPFRSEALPPAIPNLSSPTPKVAPPSPTPHADGTDAVFDSPQPSIPTESNVASTVPEPANLRESDHSTVENMEAQLEAMNIGLSGEEAAVAVDINHAAPHHQQGEFEHLAKSHKVDEKVLLDSPLERDTPESVVPNGNAKDTEAVVDESIEGPVVNPVNEVNEANEANDEAGASTVANGTASSTELLDQSMGVQQEPPNVDSGIQPIKEDDLKLDGELVVADNHMEDTFTRSENAIEPPLPQEIQAIPAVVDETTPDPVVDASDVVGIPSPDVALADNAQEANQDPPSNEEHDSTQSNGIDAIKAPELPNPAVQDVSNEPAAAVSSPAPSPVPEPLPITESTVVEPTPDPNEDVHSTPTSANPSRAASPDGPAKAATTTNTSGNASKKKKKKKGKK